MIAPWVVEEMRTAALEDARLNSRLAVVLDRLGALPTVSIPAACNGYAETAAAYRLFDNDRVTFEKVLAPHTDATRLRMEDQPVVLLVQDTTELDLTRPEQQVIGAGLLDGSSRRGALLHVLHAFTPEGTPLGTLQALAWTRSDEPAPTESERERRKKHTPIEEKESHRWVESLKAAQAEAGRNPTTQYICVADSEADIYELLVAGTSEPEGGSWIVRAGQDRATRQAGTDSQAATHLHEQVLGSEVLFSNTITVRGRKQKIPCDTRTRRQARVTRRAEVEVRAATVTLRPPWRASGKLPVVTVQVVLVREVNPPTGEEPVEWMLLSNLPIDTIEQVRLVVQYYCVRWMVEILFRTLKSGCRVESRRFEQIDRLTTCLAVYLIVAWRTLYVCRLGRECPDADCEILFEPVEWKSVYHFVHRKPPPRRPPPLHEMLRTVAGLGGYVNRKRNDPPGPQTIWLGLQRLHDIAQCYLAFGPQTPPG
jgi:Transposase Tn5 dimerisation domain/Transposase DNA-binding